MDFNTLDWLLALLPPLAVLGLMIAFRWDSGRAGLAGWLAAVILAAARFGAGADALGVAQLEALILVVDVALIVWGALLLYQTVERAGALAVIADALARLSTDRLVQALLLGWVFASFLQGIGGFGVPMAIVAPLLIGIGVPRGRAVVIPALGHSWAVTFGSLGVPFVVLIETVDLPGEQLAGPAALLLGALGYVVALMAAHALEGRAGIRRVLPFVVVVGTAMGAVQLALATNGLWTLGAVGAGLAGFAAAAGWLRWQRSRRPADAPVAAADGLQLNQRSRPRPPLALAIAGYVILIALALPLRGIEPLRAAVDRVALAVDLPATTTDRGWQMPSEEDEGFGIPAHPGLLIIYSSAIVFVLYRRRGCYDPGAGRAILAAATRQTRRVVPGILLMVALGATMARAGMIAVLAEGLGRVMSGALYAFAAPVIGALGAFVTGSNVSSNAVFGMPQRSTAELLALPVLIILGAQTAAAAVISVMSPAKVAVGASTVAAAEGEVIRRLLGYGAILVALTGVLTWIAVLVFS